MNKNIIYTGLLIFAFTICLNSCEDSVPMEFKEENIVEALLLVGEPIQNIILIKTQPVFEPLDYNQSLYSEAIVKISEGDVDMFLEFRDSASAGYFFPDTNYLVKPETKYKIEITYPDNSMITGETTTPGTFGWIVPPKKSIYFPKDHFQLEEVDSLEFKWNFANLAIPYFPISIKCIDTLNYGFYLQPPTKEMNSRILKPWSQDRHFRELTSWSFVANNKSPVIWNYFRWFGLHEIAVFAPDINFLKWMLQYYVDRYYNHELGSVTGGLGVFGSAAVLRDTIFVIKYQP